MKFQLKHGKEQLNSEISQKHFSNFVKGEIKQLKRNKPAAHQMRSKVNAFERQLKRDNISFGSGEYVQRAKGSFPGFDPVSPLLKAEQGFNVNEDKSLEHEADVMGKKAAEGGTVDIVKMGKGIQKKESEGVSNKNYESYKNEAYTLSKDSKLSNITEKDGKEIANKVYNTEKKYAINSEELIPKGLKVRIVTTDFSYEKSGKTFAKKEVAKVSIIDETNHDWNNRTVWTTRTNISQETAKNGYFTITASDANTRKEGVEVKGQQRTIPKDTKIKLTDYRTIGSNIFVRAIDKETNEDFGWINVSDLGKDIYNESFGIEKAKYISEAPNHSTINRDATKTYKYDGYHYPEKKEDNKKVLVEKGAKVVISKTEGNYVEVSYLTDPGKPIGWTAKSNLKQQEQDGCWLVIDSDARLRSKEPKYVHTGKNLSAGQFVIEKETSLNANPNKRYVRVSLTEKKDGTYIEKDGSEVWVKQEHLTSNWANAKGKHASWIKGRYLGQIDLVNTMGKGHNLIKMRADTKNPENDMHPKYLRMTEAAKSDGVILSLASGFRNYPKQKELYNKWKNNPKKYNKAAYPGTSRHQIGIAIDLNNCKTNGGNNKTNKWLMKNAYKFGYVKTVNIGITEAHHWVYLPNEVRMPKEIEKKSGDKAKKYQRYYFAVWSPDTDKEWSTYKWKANCYDVLK